MVTRVAIVCCAAALVAGPRPADANTSGRLAKERPRGAGARAPLQGTSGRAPTALEDGVVAFDLPQGMADLITGTGVDPGLAYKGSAIGLEQRTADIPLVLCPGDKHVPDGNTWTCQQPIDEKLRDLGRGPTTEYLADLIKSGGTYRLYWRVPPADEKDPRKERGAYTAWSKPFHVKGRK